MAGGNFGTLNTTCSSTVGLWCEVTTNANIQCLTTVSNTVTFPASTTGTGSFFNNTFQLPIAVSVLNSSNPNINGNPFWTLNSNLGISNVFQNSSGINVTFTSNGGGTANMPSGTRLLFVFNNGV